MFDCGELFDFGVKTFTAPRTAEIVGVDAGNITRRLIARFKPSGIVVNRFGGYHPRPIVLERAVTEIKDVAQSFCIPLELVDSRLVNTTQIDKANGGNSAGFALVGETFPELRRIVHFQNRSQREYYSPVLSAVAIGMDRSSY